MWTSLLFNCTSTSQHILKYAKCSNSTKRTEIKRNKKPKPKSNLELTSKSSSIPQTSTEPKTLTTTGNGMSKSLQNLIFRLCLKFTCLYYPTYIWVSYHPSHHQLALLINPLHLIVDFWLLFVLASQSNQNSHTNTLMFILHHGNAVVANSGTPQATEIMFYFRLKKWNYACSDQQSPTQHRHFPTWSMARSSSGSEMWKRKV